MPPKRKTQPSFSSRINQLLEEKEISQVELAKQINEFAAATGSDLTTSQSRVSAWVRTPGISVGHDMLTLVADYWGVTTDFLLGRTDERHAPWMTKEEKRASSPDVAVGDPGELADSAAPRTRSRRKRAS